MINYACTWKHAHTDIPGIAPGMPLSPYPMWGGIFNFLTSLHQSTELITPCHILFAHNKLCTPLTPHTFQSALPPNLLYSHDLDIISLFLEVCGHLPLITCPAPSFIVNGSRCRELSNTWPFSKDPYNCNHIASIKYILHNLSK